MCVLWNNNKTLASSWRTKCLLIRRMFVYYFLFLKFVLVCFCLCLLFFVYLLLLFLKCFNCLPFKHDLDFFIFSFFYFVFHYRLLFFIFYLKDVRWEHVLLNQAATKSLLHLERQGVHYKTHDCLFFYFVYVSSCVYLSGFMCFYYSFMFYLLWYAVFVIFNAFLILFMFSMLLLYGI